MEEMYYGCQFPIPKARIAGFDLVRDTNELRREDVWRIQAVLDTGTRIDCGGEWEGPINEIPPKEALAKRDRSLVELAAYYRQRRERPNGFTSTFKEKQAEVHALAKEKGWWKDREDLRSVVDNDPAVQAALWGFATAQNRLACLALVISEISESVEGIRAGNPPDDKIPEFSSAEAELADAVIRIMDLAEHEGWRLAEAIEAKHEFNKTRSHKHGGKVV